MLGEVPRLTGMHSEDAVWALAFRRATSRRLDGDSRATDDPLCPEHRRLLESRLVAPVQHDNLRSWSVGSARQRTSVIDRVHRTQPGISPADTRLTADQDAGRFERAHVGEIRLDLRP